MRSIMHDKREHTCYLCMLLHGDSAEKRCLQEHHVVFGAANRKLSERYGLKVYLCTEHHLETGGPYAVHRNPEVRNTLCKMAQITFEKIYPELSFRAIFGKNYIDERDRTLLEDLRQRVEQHKEGFLLMGPGEGIEEDPF